MTGQARCCLQAEKGAVVDTSALGEVTPSDVGPSKRKAQDPGESEGERVKKSKKEKKKV